MSTTIGLPSRRTVRCALFAAQLCTMTGGCGSESGDDPIAPMHEPPPSDAGSPDLDAATPFALPRNDASVGSRPPAESQLPIFAYHAWDDEVFVVLPESGCYASRTSAPRCTDCATKITVVRASNCAIPSASVRIRVPAGQAAVVTNPVRNTGIRDESICDAELAFARRFYLSDDNFAFAQSRNYAPAYRERIDDRLATTDLLACPEAAGRLRSGFYPWSK